MSSHKPAKKVKNQDHSRSNLSRLQVGYREENEYVSTVKVLLSPTTDPPLRLSESPVIPASSHLYTSARATASGFSHRQTLFPPFLWLVDHAMFDHLFQILFLCYGQSQVISRHKHMCVQKLQKWA